MTRRMTDAGSLPTVCRWEGMPVSEGNSARRVAELPQRTLHIQNMPLNKREFKGMKYKDPVFCRTPDPCLSTIDITHIKSMPSSMREFKGMK
jgi:hypothetical protein